jgi:hypothetical protein
MAEHLHFSGAASARALARVWLGRGIPAAECPASPVDVHGLSQAFHSFGTKRSFSGIGGRTTKCCASGTCERPVTLVFAGPLSGAGGRH